METIKAYVNSHSNEFFIAEDESITQQTLGPDWSLLTFDLPFSVIPRDDFPDGLLQTKEDVCKIFFADKTEIIIPSLS